MTARRIKLISLLSVLMIAVAVALSQVIYPIRVTFEYTYNGRRFETSYLTLMRMSLRVSKVSIVSWGPSRDKMSTLLPDGSVLMLKADWPFEWQYLQNGQAYHSRARWMWLNSSEYPAEIVYADGASRLSPQDATTTPFVWTDATSSIERLGETYLLQAAVEDRTADDAIALLASSDLGPRPWEIGRLYAGIEAAPLQNERLDEFRKLDGWISLSGGCRLFVQKIGPKGPAADGLVRRFDLNRILVRHADVWSDDGGPHANEAAIMYPAGKPQLDAEGNIQSHVRPVLQQLHAVEYQNKRCSGIELPSDSNAAYLEFADGSILGIYPSLKYAVLK